MKNKDKEFFRDYVTNLTVLCSKCNSDKSNKY